MVAGSLQPNQPGVLQVLLLVLLALNMLDVGREDGVVIVGTGAALGVVATVLEEVLVVVVVSSLQPNQPGVLHVEVDELSDELVDVEPEVVVVLSSKQPHQPGVLHVSVLVRVRVLELLLLVVVSVPLLSKNFQL